MWTINNQILFEDNHLLAINKGAGLLSHGDKSGDASCVELVKNYLKEKYNKPGNVFATPVHRLDRPVSGVLLFARTSKALERLTRQFARREVTKVYYGISDSVSDFVSGELVHYLIKDEKRNISTAYNHAVNRGKKAVLRYEILADFEDQYLYKIQPKTGRSHQIRAQMAKAGCPLLGDLKYGSNIKTDGKSIGLHAGNLTFLHPVKKEKLVISAPFPNNEIWNHFEEWEVD